jgi:hypothetical protein
MPRNNSSELHVLPSDQFVPHFFDHARQRIKIQWRVFFDVVAARQLRGVPAAL